MTKVIIDQPHIIQPGYHLASGSITKESRNLVRRGVPHPDTLSHPASRRNTLQKLFFAEAARAWSALSSAEKYVWAQLWQLPPPEHPSPPTEAKFLSGRDYFISRYIRSKKAGTIPATHLIPQNIAIRTTLTIALPDAQLTIHSRSLVKAVYSHSSDIDGHFPTTHLSPTWEPFTLTYSRPCFQKRIHHNYIFFEPYKWHSLYLPFDFISYVMESDYCPTGWLTPITHLHGGQVPFDQWDWLSPPGRGIRIDVRILNAFTLELHITQYPGNDAGTLNAGITQETPGTYASQIILWHYFNHVHPDPVHYALVPPHPFAIIDYSQEPPVVIEYRDEPWGES